MKRNELLSAPVAVFGAARTGIASAKLLLRHGNTRVRVLDEVPGGESARVRLAATLAAEDLHAVYFGREECMKALEGVRVLVKSPGIPQDNPVVLCARERGIRIISEIELAAAFAHPKAKIVAVTGTNGKTTTTAWLAHILKGAGLNAVACGNIGEAWANVVDRPEFQSENAAFALEVSSFQLEDIEDFSPHVAVLTNLAPDHLDRYADYAAYVAAKRNILRAMPPQAALVWNWDNPDSHAFARDILPRSCPFSAHTDPQAAESAWVHNGVMMLRCSGGEQRLAEVSTLPLPGRHNLENALAAALAAALAGVETDAIRRGLATFQGVEHRIEFCGELGGVRFYNDSKATNLDSVEKALQSFADPIVLIAGGRDKKSDYATLSDLVRTRVKALVTIGEAAPLIEAAWGKLVPTQRATTMEDAVRCAAELAAAGDVVLLSPACASYDMYANYEERGRDFKACVARLIEESH